MAEEAFRDKEIAHDCWGPDNKQSILTFILVSGVGSLLIVWWEGREAQPWV